MEFMLVPLPPSDLDHNPYAFLMLLTCLYLI